MAFPPLDQLTRDRLTTRFGSAIAAWLDALPAQATALADRWDVVLGAPPHVDGGATSVVVHGRLPDGAAVVLKLAPEPALAVAEGEALAAAAAGGGEPTARVGGRGPAGDGASAPPPLPRLLARDAAAGALLLEAIEPGTPLDARAEPPDPALVGALLRGLRAIPAAGLPPLRERVDWCFELFARRDADDADRAALARGRALALRLADDGEAAPAFVHGDLHPGNVLDGGPGRGLVAIDPRPCAGDPGFDAADLVLWGVASDGEAERRIAAVAAAAGYPEERLAAWCAALAAMDAVSLAARPGEVPHRAERLATLRALMV